jgi:serine/threonine protein kinase
MITIEDVKNAKHYTDLFGFNPAIDLRKIYLKTLREIHPDVNPDPDATDMSAKFQVFYTQASAAIDNNTFGAPIPDVSIVLGSQKYDIYRSSFGSDCYESVIANHYPCHISVAGSSDYELGWFNVAKHPRDNDLIANEVKIVKHLFADSDTANGYGIMLPNIVGYFDYREDKITRKATVVTVSGEFVTLAQAIQMYPNGIPAENVVWIIRRVLDVLGYIHFEQVIHGSVTPQNLLVGVGGNHEIKLTNFYVSVKREDNKHIPLLLDDEAYYPNEILRKEIPTVSVDLFTFAKSIKPLIDPNSYGAKQILSFLESFLFKSPDWRPQNAYALRVEFTTLTEKLWSVKKYIPFMKGN